MQRVHDPAAVLVVFERDRPLIEVGLGIGCRVLAVGDRDATEVFAGCAVFVHVARGEHRDPRRRCQQTERRRPREADLGHLGAGRTILHAGAEACPRSFVEGAVHEHVVGLPRRNGHRRLCDRAARGAAAVVDHREVGQIGDAEVAGDFDLGVHLCREGDDAVHLLGVDACVVERGLARFDGQRQRCAARVLRELGGADADDGGGSGVVHHDRQPAFGSARSMVPVTCAPSELRPSNATCTTPCPSTTSFLATEPDIVIVS